MSSALEWIVRHHAERNEAGHVVGWLERALQLSTNAAERRRLDERLATWRATMDSAGQTPVAPEIPAAR